jgi:SAUR family protein
MLLEKAADEFGFDQSGGLTIPCEIETFKYLLNCMESTQLHHDDDDDTSGKLITSLRIILYSLWLFL